MLWSRPDASRWASLAEGRPEQERVRRFSFAESDSLPVVMRCACQQVLRVFFSYWRGGGCCCFMNADLLTFSSLAVAPSLVPAADVVSGRAHFNRGHRGGNSYFPPRPARCV